MKASRVCDTGPTGGCVGYQGLRVNQICALLVILLLGLSCPFRVHAHGGGLNSEGCHNNRKTGDYHCDRAAALTTAAPKKGSSAARQAWTPASGPTRAFRNCAEARAAGAAPVNRGDAGYGPHLDRDNDGVGCE
ncbi:MAG: excalibur calcium-binding domain-containing protein [Lysobacteraceae bacterium]